MNYIIGVFFLLSSTLVLSSEVTLGKAFKQLPNSISKSCSSSFVRSVQTEKLFYITANHCLYKNGIQILLEPQVSDWKFFRTFYSETTIEMPFEKLRKDWLHDVAYTSFDNIYQFDISTISPEDINISSYNLAESNPQVGEDVFLVGFPSNGVSHQKPLKVKCKYLGKSISGIPATGKYTIQSAAECIDIGVFQGASGGAILNNKGDYIGVFTTVFDFETTNNKKHIFYTSITEQNIDTDTILLSQYNTSETIENGIEFSRDTNRKRLILDVKYDSYGDLKEVSSSRLDGTPYQQLIFRKGKIDSYQNY